MSGDFIELERVDQVAVVTLNRPDKRNAMHEPMWEALRDTLRAVAESPPHAVVLVGQGAHFSAGMDLSPENPLLQKLLPAVQGKDTDAVEAIIVHLKDCVGAATDIPVPVIAAVEGVCIGGGLEVALACDLVVASATARFALPETKWGMVPDVGGTTRLARRIGRARAADLILSGREIDAATAEAWGLVNRLCDAGQAEATALGLAADIAACAPTATREALTVLRALGDHTDTESFRAETTHGARAVTSGELIEGAMAFMQKRPPRWTE